MLVLESIEQIAANAVQDRGEAVLRIDGCLQRQHIDAMSDQGIVATRRLASGGNADDYFVLPAQALQQYAERGKQGGVEACAATRAHFLDVGDQGSIERAIFTPGRERASTLARVVGR